MPFIAFELDALKRVPAVARAAGIREPDLGYGLVQLWEYCWTEKTDHVDQTHVAGFFGGDRARVSEALVAFRFLAPDGERFRVKGADRYLRVTEARKEGGRKAAAAGNLRRGNLAPARCLQLESSSSSAPAPAGEQLGSSSSSAPALTSNTEHRTPKIEELPPTPSVKPAPLPPPAADAAEAELNGDGEGAFPPTGLGFFGWTQHERAQQGLIREGDPPRNILEWHDAAVAEVGIEGLQRAYLRYLNDGAFRDRGWPIRVFMSDAVWRPRTVEQARRWRL
jgi:hypothetical protein